METTKREKQETTNIIGIDYRRLDAWMHRNGENGGRLEDWKIGNGKNISCKQKLPCDFH